MYKLLSGLLAGAALLVAAPSTLAAPVTVDLRIEGPSRTLFEGPVTTDVRTFHFTSATPHRCDGTAANQGPSATPVPTRGAALTEAAERAPFTMRGDWDGGFDNPIFKEVGGEDVSYDSGTQKYLVEYKNETLAQVGACAAPVGSGDRVLYAHSVYGDQLLALSGPASARPGGTATVKVTDAATGAAVAGATVGDAVTGADGSATVGPFTQRGDQDLKASKDGAVRSNRLRVCVSDGRDGFCSSAAPGGASGPASASDSSAPVATIARLRNGAVYSRRRAPRLLRGSVSADPSGLHSVKLRLTRRVGRKCSYFSGSRERFRPMRCGRGSFFRIGDRPDWSYLLPKRLGRGRYVLEVKAIDGAFNRGKPTRVRFRVR